MVAGRTSTLAGWLLAFLVGGSLPGLGEVDFATQVWPILKDQCVECHGPEKVKGKVRLDSRAAALRDEVVIPGNSEDSVLIQVVEDGDMPPEEEGPPLSKAQIAVLRAWIEEGAKWGDATPKPEAFPEVKPAGSGDEEAAHGDSSPLAGPADVSKLPPASSLEVDFDRDIQPILQRSCIECHGPERPKGGFRLDNRASALEGGRGGVAIVPGKSAESPFIHFVARLVEDMEMPPEDSGPPLDAEEIGLLRAWIDQGAKWGSGTSTPDFAFTITPTVGFVAVDGNEQKFREHAWQRDGWTGGVGRFTLEHWIDPETRLTGEGLVLLPDHQEISFDLRRQEVGFVRGGFAQGRRYFNDVGGYHEDLASPAFRLGRDLHLETGRLWAEVGITPPDWPEVVVGYEYRYKRGEKSSLHWGPSRQDGPTRSIHPALKDVDEDLHRFWVDARYAGGGWEIENNFLAEFHDLETRRLEASPFASGAVPDVFTTVGEAHESWQLSNTFSVQKEVTDWWLLSAGYYYSYLDADSSLQVSTFDTQGELVTGDHWSAQPVVFDWQTHIFNASTRLGPWEGLSLSAGVQSNWEEQDAMGSSVLLFEVPDPSVPVPPFFLSTAHSDRESVRFAEHAALRYDRIPHTVLFAEADLEHDFTDYHEDASGNLQGFLRDTESRARDQDYRAGFTLTPWRQVSLDTMVRYRIDETRYEHDRDFENGGGPNPGYSAFILGRDLESREIRTRLNVRPRPWLRTMVTYQRQASDYRTATEALALGGRADTPGGWVRAGEYDADIYSLNVVLTPWAELSLHGSLSYHDSSMRSATHGAAVVDDFEGEVWSLLLGANWALNDRTSLAAHYAFSRADFAQDLGSDGLELGIDYEQHSVQVGLATRLNERVLAQLQYQFQHYREPSAGDFNDYTAHGVFLSCTFDWR